MLLAPLAAVAQPVSYSAGPAVDSWLELHLGAAIPQDPGFHRLDPGVAAGLAFGARFSRWIGAELAVGYEGASGKSGGADERTHDVAIAPSLRVRYPFRPVELSAYAGPALHIAWYSVEPAGGVPFASHSDTGVGFGAQVGAALGFHLSPTVLVGADVRRTFVQAHFGGSGIRFDTLRTAVTLTYQL